MTGQGAKKPSGVSPGQSSRVPVLFIGGVGRSGSTILDMTLSQHPRMCGIGEFLHAWQRGLVEDNLCGCGKCFRDCPFWSAVGDTGFGGWENLDAAHLLALKHAVDRNRFIPLMMSPQLWPRYRVSLDEYSDILERCYRAMVEVSGCDVVVDSGKHASYAFLLAAMDWIDLKVVHLVRDSRGVAYSWTKKVKKTEVHDRDDYMTQYTPTRTGLRWTTYNAMFHLLARRGVSTLLVRYEDFVSDPRFWVDEIVNFSNMPDADLDFVGDAWVEIEPTHTVAGNPSRFKTGRIQLHLDEAWRHALDPSDRRVVTGLTWPLLRTYHYSGRGSDA